MRTPLADLDGLLQFAVETAAKRMTRFAREMESSTSDPARTLAKMS
jgi:hypothetical protein